MLSWSVMASMVGCTVTMYLFVRYVLMSALSWPVTIILLFTAIRHQRKIPKLVILLISSFFWTACAAIMKVMFGLFGEMAYLGILFVVMLILTLTNTDREES